MTNAAMDLTQYLKENGWLEVYTDFEPEVTAMQCNDVVVSGYGGEASDLYWNGEYPRVQIMTRSGKYVTAQENIQKIYRLLHGKAEFFIGANRYLLLQALQTPFFLRRDERNINHFIFNLRIIRETI